MAGGDDLQACPCWQQAVLQGPPAADALSGPPAMGKFHWELLLCRAITMILGNGAAAQCGFRLSLVGSGSAG